MKGIHLVEVQLESNVEFFNTHARAGCVGLVGGGVPLAAGSAFSHRMEATDAVAVTYFGDGAMNIGSTLETLNLAAAWRQHQFFAGVTANTDPARATKPLTRTQIAVELGWSPDYLNRRWNGDQRCRFSDYVEILEAVHRLRNEAIPLSEVFGPLDSARELYPPDYLTGSP